MLYRIQIKNPNITSVIIILYSWNFPKHAVLSVSRKKRRKIRWCFVFQKQTSKKLFEFEGRRRWWRNGAWKFVCLDQNETVCGNTCSAENWHEVSLSAKSFIVLLYSGKAINFQRCNENSRSILILTASYHFLLGKKILFLTWIRIKLNPYMGRKVRFSCPRRFIDARLDAIRSNSKRVTTATNYVLFDIIWRETSDL